MPLLPSLFDCSLFLIRDDHFSDVHKDLSIAELACRRLENLQALGS